MRLGAILLVLQLSVAYAGSFRHSKIAEDLRLEEGEEHEVIIVFRQQYDQQQSRRVRNLGGKLRRELPLVNAGHYQLTNAQLTQFANDPDVEAIHPNREVRSTAFNGKMDYAWMSLLNAASPNTSVRYDGTGIGVALIDSGVDTSSELTGGRPIYSQSFVTGENTSDWFGHGDHVAGIIAGTGAGSTGPEFAYKVRGIAP